MKKKIIQGWGALRCRLGTCVERLQRVPEAGLFPAEAAESAFVWLILDVHRLFRMFFYIPSNIWNNRFFHYWLHPSTFRPSLLKFLCGTSAVVCLQPHDCCLSAVYWLNHAYHLYPLFMRPIFGSHHVYLHYVHSLINQRVMYWHISLYTTTSVYNLISVYLYICIIYIYISYMCILCIHRHHFPGRWGGAQSPEGHCLHGAAAFDVMGRTECINGGIVGIIAWVY